MQATMTRDEDGGTRTDQRVSAEPDEDAAHERRCRQGDVQAFGLLVGQHEASVRALVARILGPSATADDVDDAAQDVFVQAWRGLPRFRGDSRFSTWLYRVATNLAIKQWRRRRKGRNVVAEDDLPESIRLSLADPQIGPDEEAQRRAQDRALRSAIETLPEKQRMVILLHYFEGCTCEEIAQMIGCSVGTIWSRLHYGCCKLRDALPWMAVSA
jgi:RNA polymerase sigma-70 factor (ECF subfamily)